MEVRLKLVENEEDRAVARSLIERHHSYVPTYNSVGRRIDWLVMIDGEVKGMIGIGSATYPPCKDLLRYLNISKGEFRSIFNTIANNWRFCMAEKIPNIGTRVLKLMRQEASKEWEKKYHDKLEYLMTFVGGGHNGAVYKADNWQVIGETAGLPPHKSCSMKWDDGNTLKAKFVKPDGKNKKLIFIKKI